MKTSTIKQLMENYINQKKSNKNITIKKQSSKANNSINIKKNIHKDIKNPSIKSRRKPRIYNGNKNYFELNKKKLKSCSRYKDTHNNKKDKNKILVKNIRPISNMNRSVCTDGYGNIIVDTHDRNLSAPSLNYDNNIKYYKKNINKKKKNNIIKLNKADKKLIDENLIHRDNYMNYNSMRGNNLILNHDKLPSNIYNKNNNITENNVHNYAKKEELDDDTLIKVKTLDKEDYNYINIPKNNLNIKNYYKNKNKTNKKYNDNNNDNSTFDISNFIKDCEIIKNKQESIALLKEQMKEQDNYFKNNNKPKLNKTIDTNLNDNQINSNNKNKYKRNNRINLINKNEYAISNFQSYNKYGANKKNKNIININKANNNTYYNEISNISEGLTPNKQIANTTRGNINLSNSSNNKTINISTNISNNNNNFGKKINLTSIYGEENEKEENDNNIEYSNPKEQEIIIDKSKECTSNISNEKNIKNNFYTEVNEDKNNIKDSTNDNVEAFSYRSNNNNEKANNKINNVSFSDDKNNAIKPNNKKNIENNKKENGVYIQKSNKNISSNINMLGKEPNLFSLNIKNKKNFDVKGNNKIKEKKDNINHIPSIQKQSKPLNNNKKKNIIKNNKILKINDNNPLSSRFHTINNDHNERYNNFDDKQIKNKKSINNNDKSYDIVNKNKNKEDVSKQKLKKLSKANDMHKNIENLKIEKKNSCKPYINKNKHNSVDTNHDENISQNKVKKYLTKGDFKYKSIYKIGVICEAGEVVILIV